jgi:hypothetical protein
MFFEVQAKCGHVGMNKYVLKNFYIKTDSAKKAAYIIRNVPRVKHDHKDAIRNVREITYEEYVEGSKRMDADDYFRIHNSSKQKGLLSENVFYEEYEERKKSREVNFKLKKTKILVLEARKMILGAYYG